MQITSALSAKKWQVFFISSTIICFMKCHSKAIRKTGLFNILFSFPLPPQKKILLHFLGKEEEEC